MSLTSRLVCRVFTRGDNKRDAGLTTPDDILRYDDIAYGTDRKWQVLDVYRPRGAEGKLPVIVSVHGGGWVYGDKERYQYYCMDLAERGFAVVNFTYRLAPKHKYPKQMEDTLLAFRWVHENADRYGFDLNNIFAVGDSAGGHLLALFCIACADHGYASKYDLEFDTNMMPKAVALNCGAYEVPSGGAFGQLVKDLLPGRGTPEERDLISPLQHITSDFPPAYVMTAVKDFLREDAKKMHSRLDELGVQNEFRDYDNEEHSLEHVFHVNIKLPEAGKCNDDECRFFRSFLEKEE